jgi:hypothetical protein
MYDTGGHIPSGQFGIVGENGPEIVNGPALPAPVRLACRCRALESPAGNQSARTAFF